MCNATSNLLPLLKNAESNLMEGAEREIHIINFDGNKGEVTLHLSVYEGWGVNGVLSIENGELSTNELHMLRGYCRQENYEALLTDDD